MTKKKLQEQIDELQQELDSTKAELDSKLALANLANETWIKLNTKYGKVLEENKYLQQKLSDIADLAGGKPIQVLPGVVTWVAYY